ncbi:MAG: transglycosylase domain-containing protein [Acidimicrobiia bacterium]
MERHGWLSGGEAGEAAAAPLGVVDRRPAGPGAGTAGRAPHFAAYVAREGAALDALGPSTDVRRQRLFTGGYTVETTLDPKAYEAAVQASRRLLGEDGDPTTAVVSVQPGDGAIRVLFGGLDPELQFDPATQGRRQPGSSFKPFVYLAMLKAGIDPRTTFDSGSPQTIDCRGTRWTVNNYEGRGGGAATADTAMAQSINTVYAQIMARVGPGAVVDVAQRAGIPREAVTPSECAMALGGLREGVSPLEQAAAFATFAAKGTYAEPYAMIRIVDRDGSVVYDRGRPETRRAFSEREAGVLNAVLESVVENGTGTAAAVGRPMAGKTGTTENYGNAWFIGYVPQLATAVWVGHPEGDRPMTNVRAGSVTGGSFPARIFSGYMREALAGVPVQDLHWGSPDELALRGGPATTVVGADASTTTSSTPPTTRRPVITLPPEPPTTRGTVRPAPPRTAAPVVTVAPTTTTSTRAPGTPLPTVPVPTTTTTVTARER